MAVPTSPIDSTFGALFIGMVLAAVLWGVSCVQTWYYFDNYRHDSIFLKGVVFLTWLSDTIHQVLITHVLYYYTISHFGDTDALENIVWTLYVEVVFNAITGFLVQSFFAYRIWTFRKNFAVLSVIVLLILGEVGTSVAYVGGGAHLPTFTGLKKLKPLSMSINVLAAAGDVLISVAICFFLNNAKSGFAWSNNVINRLMLFAINTGLLTSICACASLLFILALPNTLVYFAFYFMIGRFYVNSLLATLNSRKSMRTPASTEAESHSLQDRARSTFSARLRGIMSTQDNNKPHTTPRIEVQISTIKADDYGNDEASLQQDEETAVVGMQNKADDFKFPSNKSSEKVV
ncbi:uncharacterized protein EV420DRAFT_155447 [Desarmillaria tabescens]|uniref:DUF6534 domain-containing protein n=1 Tax=Armillaria tabescens TaxID=1929756 RepID=A0AA39J858_ARMTA|nr:uncharacterized protein EV420DRAFT_155447 [Desarmillaria tabescens]KAK0437932.1 hypothetical protein EV420DRAFT_155447 [Desarmillaria tabescens]